jgi:hypothetical protein
MPINTIDDYDIEFTAEPLEGSAQWAAYVEITTPSTNPMHLDTVYPKQRVAADASFADEAQALAAAEAAGPQILERLRA